MLGTVSDYTLREGDSSIAIIRSTAQQKPAGSHLYMFATDGSRAAAVAFCMLCHQLVRPGDKLLLVSCSYDHSTAGGDAETFKEYTTMADSLKVGVQGVSVISSDVRVCPVSQSTGYRLSMAGSAG